MSATAPAVSAASASVSTHVLDTATGRPAEGVAVELSARSGADGTWTAFGTSVTDADGRCRGLPPPPRGTTHVRLRFDVGPYAARGTAGREAFFPEVAVAFAVAPGEHHHVPLLLSPFGYSVYRGS
ncbi:hydroxyisourate hydrolase [Streptomyces rectiverticillatus]|uniref:hydroxyisourate hydrolase n=1 Tax=Streptomyces rectiverticillatus TaxID=173860 RepID=UPI0015C31869|nr:hydroxyisourate hydrolase [Streptomyces rectiverticillatus]QLE74570.1 hydroxyisourate hydrolase [Streptomyces rectiverticillatus]